MKVVTSYYDKTCLKKVILERFKRDQQNTTL